MKGLSMATATAALMALGALAAVPAPADGYVLNFDTDAAGNPLGAGFIIDTNNQPWEDLGVKITTNRPNDYPLMLFNSSCKPSNWNANYDSLFSNPCSGGDNDLATGTGQYLHKGKTIPYKTTPQGNVLILSEDGDSSDPDDWGGNGGDFIFTFDDLVTLDEVSIIDVDTVDYTDPTGTGYLTAFGVNGVLDTLPLRAGGDNGFEVYDFDGLTDVTKLIVHLPGSGAISGVEFTQQLQANNDPVDIPEPASTLGLLALGACGLVSTLKRKRG